MAGSWPHQRELQEFGALNGGKIVIRNQRQHGSAGWSVNREAFLFVDFKAQIRLEQDANPLGHTRGRSFLAVEDAQPRAANDAGGGIRMRASGTEALRATIDFNVFAPA